MSTLRSSLPVLVALVVSSLAFSSDSRAEKTIRILILKEHGIGSAAQAQPHVDKLVEIAAQKNNWSEAKGTYFTSRSTANKYIKTYKPDFAILSLGAFLSYREPKNLKVLGVAEVKNAGGRQYHLISKDASDLDGCKGAKLATNHHSDEKFIDKVVSGADFDLDDFKVVKTKRPVQTIKYVVQGKAVCALIDDAQFDELSHIDGTDGIKSVWKSKMLPGMAIVAFSGAGDDARAKFKNSLSSICEGDGKSTCEKVGLKSLNPADESTYQEVIDAYGQ